MAEPKHTPGSWEVEREDGEVRIYSGDDACIADLTPDFDPVGDAEEVEANAILIAQAPMLADQLEEAVSILRALRIGKQPPVKLLDCIDVSVAVLRAAGRLP